MIVNMTPVRCCDTASENIYENAAYVDDTCNRDVSSTRLGLDIVENIVHATMSNAIS